MAKHTLGKVSWFLLPVLVVCVIGYVCFGGSVSAKRDATAAKADSSASYSIGEGVSALNAGQNEQAIKMAEGVLSKSTSSAERSKAYSLLITATRASQGYNAAIRRAEGIRASIKKSKRPSQELRIVNQLISDLTQRRNAYLRTISEQRKVIQAHLGSDRAAQAALKIAQCKQAIGNKTEAIDAYLSMMKDYPLTRPGWKAAQEAAWLRSSDKDNKVNGRIDLDAQLQSIAEKSGLDQARKQAWNMACGNKDFTPNYSDVLRLEAIVTDLYKKQDDDVSVAKGLNKESSEIEHPVEVANNSNVQTTPAINETSNNPGIHQHRTPRPSSGGDQDGNTAPALVVWSGTVGVSRPALSKKTQPARFKSQSQTSTSDNPDTVDPEPSPVQPEPIAPYKPNPEEPQLDQWTCDSHLRELGDDKVAVRNLLNEYLSEVDKALSPSSTFSASRSKKRRLLGVALTAVNWASNRLGDLDLTKSICQDYLMPNLYLASSNRCDCLSQDTIRFAVASAWQKAGMLDKVADLFRVWIANDTDPDSADANRIRLAEVLVKEEHYEEAISYLQQISDSSDCAGMKSIIPDLEKKAKEQLPKGESN